ncbi:hypothetical protein QBC34DRAFT_460200 [Podospora aff. communis PSN243]|uniref:Uncharacterized protein n=1 Tax=Podospora aff. communis PSN243 TaxID=3040156 RepID=A0AAV9H768_9PEZI|nr:hypothetical protein QBC34DRAFT_460200 [Podospora aff. communis PSN243]
MHHLPALLLLPLLLLQFAPTTTSSPTPQNAPPPDPTDYLPLGLQCPNGGPSCDRKRGLVMYCANGELICSFSNMVTFPIGKCSECLGSVCAKSSNDYPGESSRPMSRERKKKKRGEEILPLHDAVLAEREVMGKRQASSRCQAGWACASDLQKGFTNERCEALFPGTRAICRSY